MGSIDRFTGVEVLCASGSGGERVSRLRRSVPFYSFFLRSHPIDSGLSFSVDQNTCEKALDIFAMGAVSAERAVTRHNGPMGSKERLSSLRGPVNAHRASESRQENTGLRRWGGEILDEEEAPGEAPGKRLVRLAILVYSAMAAGAALWRVVIQGEPMFFASVAAQQRGVSFWGDVAVGVGTGLFVILLSDLLTERTQWGEDLARRLAETVGSLSGLQCVGLALLSGIGEEMFFRGALQPVVGLGWASLLFGLMHFAPDKALLPWTGFAVVMGAVLGALYLWTGSLWAPILAHVVINGVNLPRLVRRHAESSGRG